MKCELCEKADSTRTLLIGTTLNHLCAQCYRERRQAKVGVSNDHYCDLCASPSLDFVKWHDQRWCEPCFNKAVVEPAQTLYKAMLDAVSEASQHLTKALEAKNKLHQVNSTGPRACSCGKVFVTTDLLLAHFTDCKGPQSSPRSKARQQREESWLDVDELG